VEELAGQAEANLRQLGCSDVAIRIGDGSRGWREHAPYDKALLTAAAGRWPPSIPEPFPGAAAPLEAARGE
jgi:protein-L-isoaspartate(D-aspartate) O-methyltransferase